MKKINYLLFTLAILLLPISVFARGSISPSPRSLTITKGGTATFTITADNAAGRVDISSSNNSIATVNKSSEWLDNNSVLVTVTGVSVGTATINVKLTDAATYDEEELSTNYTVSVKVNEPSTQTPTNPTQPTQKPPVTQPPTKKPTTPNNVTSPTQSANENPEITSPIISPLKLLSLTVDNYPVEYQDGAYYVNTENFTESVTINATAEEGVSIIGTGVRNLTYGKNVVYIILKNESGQSNTYQVIITRPDDTNIHDTRLTTLKVVNYGFAFDPNQTEYTVKVPYNVDEIYVIAESLNSDVNIAGAGLKTLTKGTNKIYIKVSYGDSQATDYVITIKRSYSLMILLIASGVLGIGLIAALVYAYINRKAAMEARVATKNRFIAEGVRQEIQSSVPNVTVNGQKVIGEGRKTVVPTRVVSVKTPVQTVVSTNVVNNNDNDLSNQAPVAQVRLVRPTPLEQPPTPQFNINSVEEENNNI